MRIAVVGGAGSQGYALALRWAAAGYELRIGSRDPDRARRAARQLAQDLEQLGGRQPAVPPVGAHHSEAVRGAHVVVLTVPASAVASVAPLVAPCPPGQVVIDVSVGLARESGRWVARPLGGTATALEVHRLLGHPTSMAAAFHTVSAALLRALPRPLEGDDTLVFSSDDHALRTSSELASACSLRPVAAGPLEAAGAAEHLVALLLQMQEGRRHRSLGIRVTHLVPD